MKILILGVDGYLGWPTAMHLASRGHYVTGLDNFGKRELEGNVGVRPLEQTKHAHERAAIFNEKGAGSIEVFPNVDLLEYGALSYVLKHVRPDAIVHYAEQPSAPFSMMSAASAAFTQHNNVVGSLNLLWAIRENCPLAHLVKLGTMGEYGTPNIDIEEGFLEVHHNGRTDTLPFPKQPGSFYHLSKVHDSHNIEFACKAWGLRATDLNQGIVYGIRTPEMDLDDGLGTSFHYDAIFGTVLNRFCVQAVLGWSLSVYGGGNQTRSFLCIDDTLQCVTLAIGYNPKPGRFIVRNQFTDTFTIDGLARTVQRAAETCGLDVLIKHVDNPRNEKEGHYYNPKRSSWEELGLVPTPLSDEYVASMIRYIQARKDRIDPESIRPRVTWR